jgi:hypothetical protein
MAKHKFRCERFYQEVVGQKSPCSPHSCTSLVYLSLPVSPSLHIFLSSVLANHCLLFRHAHALEEMKNHCVIAVELYLDWSILHS